MMTFNVLDIFRYIVCMWVFLSLTFTQVAVLTVNLPQSESAQ